MWTAWKMLHVIDRNLALSLTWCHKYDRLAGARPYVGQYEDTVIVATQKLHPPARAAASSPASSHRGVVVDATEVAFSEEILAGHTAALIPEEDNKRSFDWLELELADQNVTHYWTKDAGQLDRSIGDKESGYICLAIFSSLASCLARISAHDRSSQLALRGHVAKEPCYRYMYME